MKKMILVLLITMLLGSCASYYVSNDYQYDEFYQRHEPYQSVDDDREAARYIARNLNRYFRRTGYARIAVLNFTDEYGDHLNRGVYFADRVEIELSRYRNMRVIDRSGLYETVYDLGFSHRGLVINKGYQLRSIARADYVLHGRIMPGTWDDVVSVRCFEVETGRVIFASTFYIERPYDLRPPGPRPHPRRYPPSPYPRPRPEPPSQREPDDDDDGQSTIKKPGEKRDPIESVGKKDLNDTKKSDSGQTQYKKKPADDTDEDSSSTSGGKDKESTVSKKTLDINKRTTDPKIEPKQPVVEPKVKTPSRSLESKKESTVSKKTLNVNKKSTEKKIEAKKPAEETEQEDKKDTKSTSGLQPRQKLINK